MERATKNESLNPVAKLHIVYGTIIMVMSMTFIVTITTLKNSYKSMAAGQGTISNSQMAAGPGPDGHPEVNSQSQTQPSNMGGGGMPSGGGMPAGGGMPPFLKKMLGEYKTSLEKNPKDIAALTGLGNMYFDSGQYPKAINFYEKVLAIDSKNTNVRADLGTCYFYSNIPDKAIKNLTMALEHSPENLNARYNLGIVYKTQGKIAEARKEWEAMKPYLKTDEEKKKLQTVLNQLDKRAS